MTTTDVMTGIGMLLAAGAGALVFSLQPQIAGGDQTFRTDPTVQQTGAPKPPLLIDKTTLIIQQNVNCWLGGNPGMTCGAERTYL